MLKLHVPASEWFDDETQTFVLQSKPCDLMLEHSLLSLSKWESKWKKPFLEEKPPRTNEEFIDYVRCMTINQGVESTIYYNLSIGMVQQIRDYITDPMTATTIKRAKNKRSGGARKIITSEVIYSWMVHYGIPFECQKWHLNRLLMLIEVCGAENGEQKKMTPHEIMRENASLNAIRRAQRKSKG